MASFKYNIARIRGGGPKSGCQINGLADAMKKWGLAHDEPYGVKYVTANKAEGKAGQNIAGVLICRESKTIHTETEDGEITDRPVETAAEFPFNLSTAIGTLEFHAGTAAIFERFAFFLTDCLKFRAIVDVIEVDLLAAVEALIKTVPKLIIRSARVSDFAANSYCNGVYTPKFMSTTHGLEFMAEHSADLQAVTVRWAGRVKRVNVTLGPNGCNSYSCDEDDIQHVRSVLKELILKSV